jgi:hypothetical protein
MSASSQSRRPWASLRNHRELLILLSLYLSVSLLYGVTIPIFETPDANGHYAYIHELTEGRGLPVQGAPSGARVTGYVASHPPLYYSLCAALTWWVTDDVELAEWSWRNPYQAMGDASRTVNKNRLIHTPAERFPWRGTPLTMHISRAVSTLLGTLAVVSTYGIALELFPDRRWLALGSASLTAFNPMFVFISARVSNDAAVAAFGSLTIWGAVRLAVRGLSPRGLALTGISLGLTVLSKLSGVALAPVLVIALLFDSLRAGREAQLSDAPSPVIELEPDQPPEGVARSGAGARLAPNQCLYRIMGRWALVILPALAVAGWWFVRNVLLYGELMGVESWLSHTATVRSDPIGVLDVVPELAGLERSYWAMFGWFNIAAAPWMYHFWWILARAAAFGLALLVVDQFGSRRLSPGSGAGLLIVAVALLLNLASVWRFIMIVLGSQGRYLMPTITSISLLLMLGITQLLPGRLSLNRWGAALAAMVGVAHLGLTLVSLFAFILPAYAIPQVIEESDLPPDMTRLNVSFAGTPIKLLGGHIEAKQTQPGLAVPVSLYWRASETPRQEYITFLQILGRDMKPIAGVDCYPGGGTFPATLWEPGVIYRDRYELPIDADARVPTSAALHVGLYDEAEKRMIRGSLPGPQPLELVLLDVVPIRPREPLSDDVQYEVGAALGESITLVGYDLSSAKVRPGGTITVTLVWRAGAPLGTEYTAFVHMLDENGDLLTQSDHPPMGGAYPTSMWDAGDVVHDTHLLTLGGSAASGSCALSIGMYDSMTGDRLPAHKGHGGTRYRDDLIVAGGLTVE